MKKKLLYILIILGTQFSEAQINEVGLMIGEANPIADIGGDWYVKPNKPAFGFLYRWNAHQRFSLRIQANNVQLFGNDEDSKIQARKQRKFSFDNNLLEVNLGIEYYFFEFDMSNRLSRPISPYLYAGASYFWYDSLYLNMENTGINRRSGKPGTLAIPFALGIKARVSPRILVSLEVGGRYTFTKNLDGSYPETKGEIKFKKFGNKNSNDWYSVVGLMVTYTFGEYPCYCW